jgi:hypothetical protein
MKYQLSEFTEFLKTPFPYLFLVGCLFLASTLLGNAGFRSSFERLNLPDASAKTNSETYTLCVVCSGPGSKDALSDIGFTVANFILFPVSVLTFGLMKSIGYFQNGVEPMPGYLFTSVFLMLSVLYGVVLPFLISKLYQSVDARMAQNGSHNSVYTGN